MWTGEKEEGRSDQMDGKDRWREGRKKERKKEGRQEIRKKEERMERND